METFYLYALQMLPLFDSDNMTNMVVRGINVIKMNLVEMIIVCSIINSSPYYSWILAEMCVNLLTIFFLLILNLTSESEIFCLPRSWRKFQRRQQAAGWRWLPGLFIETQFLYIY